MKINKKEIGNLVKRILLEEIFKASKAIEELTQENEKAGCPEETPDILSYLNAQVRFGLEDEFETKDVVKLRSVFTKVDEITGNWEVLIIFKDGDVFHLSFNNPCLAVLGIESNNTGTIEVDQNYGGV